MAMSKPDLHQDLEDIMACPVCLDRCTQPRSLPCLHVFCESCLSQLTEKSATKGTLLCPSCRTEARVPDEGVEKFPSAFLWNVLSETVDKLKQLGLHQHNSQCTLCLEEGKQSDSHSLCTDCMQTYCHQCLTSIHNRLLKNHNLLLVAEITPEDLNTILRTRVDHCHKHPDKNIDFYCENCKELVCIKCAIVDHASHTKQELESVVEGHRKSLNDVHGKFSDRVEHYEECLEKIDDALENCETNIIKKVEEVEQHGEIIMKHVQQCIKQVTSGIREEGAKSITALKTLKTTVSSELSRLQISKKRVATSLNHGNMSMVINSSTKEMQTYETILQDLQPIHDLPKVNFEIEFSKPECLTKESLIGRLQCKIESEPLGAAGAITQLVATSSDGKLMVKKMSEFKVPFYPRGVACMPDNNVIVCANTGKQVEVYKPDGQKLTTIQTPQNMKATDVAFADNSILVADSATKSIIVFDDKGSCTRSFRSWSAGSTGAGISVRNNKLFVAVGADNKLYTIDWLHGGNKTVFSHGSSGISLGGPLSSEGIMFVATNQTQVAISCYKSRKVQLYDLSGKLQFTYTGQGSHVQELADPWGIVIDAAGRILVSDHNNHCIHILSNQGQFLGYIDLKQDGLQFPIGLALNSHGQLVVASFGSQSIATYQYTS